MEVEPHTYETLEAWLGRAAELRAHILTSAGLEPMPEKTLALTFDACGGPGGSGVDTDLLELLEAESVPATLFLNQRHSPALRALRTERTSRLLDSPDNVFGEFGDAQALYFGGDMEAAIALSGQVAGRIDEVRPVADIIADTVREFSEVVGRLCPRA